MRCTHKLLAVVGLAFVGMGGALADDITAVPFIKDGKVAFAVTNHNKAMAITVGNFQIPPQKDMVGPCPSNVLNKANIIVAAQGENTIETALEPQQLIGCLARDGVAHYKAANLVKVSGSPNEYIPPKHSGYGENHVRSFPYTFESSGPGWKTSALTAGYVYFSQ